MLLAFKLYLVQIGECGKTTHQQVRFCSLFTSELASTLVLLESNQVHQTSSAFSLVKLEKMLELKSRQNLENCSWLIASKVTARLPVHRR
jgi:hypothetical protein